MSYLRGVFPDKISFSFARAGDAGRGRFGGKERKEISHIWTDSAAFLEIWK